jgi:magnesium-transporting ATPase (P-type)
MMKDLQQAEQEKSVLRWGGLAGIVGSIIFILVFVIVGVFVGDPGGVERFPDIRTARTVENGLYLIVLMVWVAHFLALYRALRERGLAPALFGSALGVLGLGVLAAGALPHVATVPLSNLYHGAGAALADQAALALMWKATWGIFDALLFTGIAIEAAGILTLGAAMLGTPAFGRAFGWLSVILGGLGIAVTVVVLADPANRRNRRFHPDHLPLRHRLEGLSSIKDSSSILKTAETRRARRNPTGQPRYSPRRS